jgi:AcrR family transcriptional regulator
VVLTAPWAPPAVAAQGLEERIVEATLCCIGRWGLAKTTLDDVARQAHCSRATVYRAFPGGKDALVQAVAQREVGRVAAAVTERLVAAESLEDLLTAGLAEAARQMLHHPALAFVVAHEPEAVVPWLAFQGKEELLAYVTSLAAPYLARFLTPVDARRAAEWAARVLVFFCVCPPPGVDLTDDASARTVVTTFLLPGLAPDR